ncbi:MAG: 2,3-bisphosphoglycerate-independent phosphoglycerate mutase [Desulfobulbaceae bacterium]|nr:2,3-bisphosphoglycerate-independent phosphoglycerate mutase [Desulfobulbaceae bacterium]
MSAVSPVMLIILDGWGVGEASDTNAVFMAKTPNMDRFMARYPATTLAAHNGAVGLPEGQMGNSEVGHLNIGAGRIVYQDYTRINRAIETGELADNEVLARVLADTLAEDKTLHLMGLVSDGGVHSHLSHLYALVRIAAEKGLRKIAVHAFMDGRDTPPQSGQAYMAELQKVFTDIGVGRVATVIGRYYAMDRDSRWERVALAWEAMVGGKGTSHHDPVVAIGEAYGRGENDEFIRPIVVVDDEQKPLSVIGDGDSVLFFNFRADRARQLTHAFTDQQFEHFPVGRRPHLANFVTCTRYEKSFDLPVLFPPHSLTGILGEVVSAQGLRQLRIAETEKYAHVTYFFNGGREVPYALEDRVLVNSPKEVATYDLKPQMSALEVTSELLSRFRDNSYGLIVLNFANADMVGHSGKLAAAISACETVDECLGQLVPPFLELGGTVLITADHGNADMMYDQETQGPHTAHTLNPVPFVLVNDRFVGRKLRKGGALKDIAPTALDVMGLVAPVEMEGVSLLQL